MKHPAAREAILSFPWKITIYKKSMSIPIFSAFPKPRQDVPLLLKTVI
jgi:hypothetical protein